MRRLRKDDQVIVLAGKDKDRVGDIVRFVGTDRVVVSGINMARKHIRAAQPGARQGIIAEEMPLHISNVAIYNAESEKADRVAFRVEESRKIRVYKSTGDEIDT